MYYVYRIRSLTESTLSFVATSTDVKRRVKMHNAGRVAATKDACPWKLTFYAAFTRKDRAKEFESYLKSPEGKKFGRKYLWHIQKEVDDL